MNFSRHFFSFLFFFSPKSSGNPGYPTKVRVTNTIYQNVSALNIVYMCVSQVSSLLSFPPPSLPPSTLAGKFAIMHTSRITITIMLMLSAGAGRDQLVGQESEGNG